MNNYFTSYYKRKEEDHEEGEEESHLKQPDFSTITRYVQETTADPEDILYNLLTSIVEERLEIIQEHLPKIIGDIIG